MKVSELEGRWGGTPMVRSSEWEWWQNQLGSNGSILWGGGGVFDRGLLSSEAEFGIAGKGPSCFLWPHTPCSLKAWKGKNAPYREGGEGKRVVEKGYFSIRFVNKGHWAGCKGAWGFSFRSLFPCYGAGRKGKLGGRDGQERFIGSLLYPYDMGGSVQGGEG